MPPSHSTARILPSPWLRIEIISGFTTFLTMAYIIFVNPAILKAAGMPTEGVIVATCLVSGLMSIAMGLFARVPFAVAPGMGLNAVVAFTIVVGMKETWQVAMGIIVLEGLLATLLVLTRVREMIMNAIPMALKHAIGVGIGLFISVIGLIEGGIISSHPATVIGLGPLKSPSVLITWVGLIVTSVLLILGIRGSILIGILVTTLFAMMAGLISLPTRWIEIPRDFSTLFQFDLSGALKLSLLPLLFGLFMTDFFDTMGTVIGLGEEAGLLDEKGRLPRLRSILLIDSLAAVAGGALGASSATTYIESAAGISEGGRTGRVSIVVGFLFFLSLLIVPTVSVVATGIEVGEGVIRHPITAPALIIVGLLMMKIIPKIDFTQYDEAIPAFLTILLIPLTYSISTGIGIGFISYVAIKTLTGEVRVVHPLMFVVATLFFISFVISP